MPALRDIMAGPWITGPWRAVLVLGITQIIAWGTIFYSPVLLAPLIAAEHGWSLSFAMGGFSLGLLTAGLVSPAVGRSIDNRGGHVVMAAGALVSALGLLGLALTPNAPAYLAAWVVLGAGLGASLYDPAFATLGRIFGAGARRPITLLTLAGGFASTAGWPATHVLIGAVGWRGTYVVFAVLMAAVCAPLYAFALPRLRAAGEAPKPAPSGAKSPAPLIPARGMVFALVTAAFTAYAFVPSALSAHLLAIFGRNGIDAATAVAIGALFGPAQVAARVAELMFGRDIHPLLVARAAVLLLVAAFLLLLLFGVAPLRAAIFAVMFGGANGLITITRGALPLALFGADGYGRTMGRIGGFWLAMQSAAPLVMAFVIERASDTAALALAAGFTVAALGCFAAIRRS
ncbi:MFS transporter [Rhodoplanes sp. Z2-YC6860]|uniref:MFS transporter n=1 Tax=Rhodoplanes sp. Z2-YC6860 TaxID=674703 RepID=UPI00078EB8CC|nr:MFS transporter [Rhodoplanes sp. Z2-YC6860]AMN40034.1 major facilitator superfamily protein [Rhodoplanes sp. Z2-YC6860]